MKSKIPRIIYFQQNLALGACEDYFYLLMEGIDKKKFDLTFFCPEDAVLTPLTAKVEALKIKVYRYSTGKNNYLLIFRLWRLFRKFKPDIIHFNDPCLNGIIAARLAGVAALIMTHHTPELNRRYNFKGRFIERIAFRHCKLFLLFTSEYDRKTGIRKDKILPKRSFVIACGLPPERFNDRYDKKEIYEEFSINEGYHLVGNIARLSIQKGQQYLIEAAALVIKQIKSIKFFIVGEGELEEKLIALVKEKGLEDYFVFTGYRNDIPRMLSAFEILIMPSLFEGLSYATVEASAMGVPVIATAVGGMRHSVTHGKTGLLIPPADPEALAEAILWMVEHPEEASQMGLAGKRRFNELFTTQRMIKETEEAYNTLIKE